MYYNYKQILLLAVLGGRGVELIFKISDKEWQTGKYKFIKKTKTKKDYYTITNKIENKKLLVIK